MKSFRLTGLIFGIHRNWPARAGDGQRRDYFLFFCFCFLFFFCDIVSVAGKARAGAGLTRDFFFGLVRKANAGGG